MRKITLRACAAEQRVAVSYREISELILDTRNTKIETYVRAGASPESAAAAAGVGAEAFAAWMNPAAPGELTAFRVRVELAAAESQAAAEIQLRKANPASWLNRRTPTRRPPEVKRARAQKDLLETLNARQALFVAEYLVDPNGTRAAIKAGYSPKTAESQASRLLRNVRVAAAVQVGLDKRASKLELTSDRILLELKRIALAVITDYFDDEWKMKPKAELTADQRAALTSIRIGENGIEVKKLSALANAMKLLRLRRPPEVKRARARKDLLETLNARQAFFVAEYLVDPNGTRAAIKAGYSPKTAESQASRLLRNVRVAAAVQVGMDKRASKLELTSDRILLELTRIALAVVTDYFDDDWKIKAKAELTPDQSAALSAVRIGENGGEFKVEKLSAIVIAMKHLGLLREKVDVTPSPPEVINRLLGEIDGEE